MDLQVVPHIPFSGWRIITSVYEVLTRWGVGVWRPVSPSQLWISVDFFHCWKNKLFQACISGVRSFLTPRCVPSPFVYARPFPFPQSPRCPYLWSHLCSHQWDEELLALLGSVSIFKGNLAVLVPQGWRKVYLLLQGAPHGEGFLSLEAGACLMVGPPPLFLGFGFPSGFFVF